MKIFICTNDNQMIGAKVVKNTIINSLNFLQMMWWPYRVEIPSLKLLYETLTDGARFEFNKTYAVIYY